jgi:hypothetical protein
MKKSYTLMVLWALLTSINAISLPKLSSYPSAQATIFLDFDGQYVLSASWNGGQPINCAPSGLNDTQITEVFNRVSEDYRPFNINITTDSTVFFAAPINRRIRIIVTPTSYFFTGVGGVSYTGSFTWGDNTPGFVFTDRLAYLPKYVGECCTHESGHTVGLSHQSAYTNCVLVDTYNTGVGSGEISWAPVMGNSYYKNMTGWNNGPTPNGCTAAQDNLYIITSQNGFTYRTDDHSDDPNTNPTDIAITNNAFSTSGLISTNTDRDAFKFTLASNGTFHLDAIPYSVNAANLDGADLDIKLTLLNSAKQTLATYNPATLLNSVIDTSLNAGTYYLMVDGTGNANTSNYGSLGSYTISGNFTPNNAMPIHDVSLTGKVDKNYHTLNWNIIADEPIRTINIETSSDGRSFNTLTTVSPSTKTITYIPTLEGDIFYRLKVTSVIDQTVYSNVITLKSGIKKDEVYKVSTFVHDQITVNATTKYQYVLSDISGRTLSRGNNNSGTSKININNSPNGMYVIQITGINGQITTERIIKQ